MARNQALRSGLIGLFGGWLLTCCVAGPGGPAPAAAGQRADAAQDQRFQALKALGARAPLTVFPVAVAGTPMADVGEALGLLLEQKAGMTEIACAVAAFEPGPGADFADEGRRFGQFARGCIAPGGYGLFAHFLAEGQAFVEVRAAIVDARGDLVWIGRQRREDAAFRRLNPREPMDCCLLLTEQVRGALGLAASAAPADGRMARLWAERSGLPGSEERAAMKERLETFRKLAREARVAVFPVRIAGDLDAPQARALAGVLAERLQLQTTASEVRPVLEIRPSRNEQVRLWDLARGLKAHLSRHPADADYALLCEYGLDRERGRAGFVHFVLLTRGGEWVIVDFQNSHHADFRRHEPTSAAGCDELVAARLKGLLY